MKRPGCNAAVTVVHTGVEDLAGLVRQGDVVVAAAGRAGLVTADMVKPGAAVVGAGTSWDGQEAAVRRRRVGGRGGRLDHPPARRGGPDDPGHAAAQRRPGRRAGVVSGTGRDRRGRPSERPRGGPPTGHRPDDDGLRKVKRIVVRPGTRLMPAPGRRRLPRLAGRDGGHRRRCRRRRAEPAPAPPAPAPDRHRPPRHRRTPPPRCRSRRRRPPSRRPPPPVPATTTTVHHDHGAGHHDHHHADVDHLVEHAVGPDRPDRGAGHRHRGGRPPAPVAEEAGGRGRVAPRGGPGLSDAQLARDSPALRAMPSPRTKRCVARWRSRWSGPRPPSSAPSRGPDPEAGSWPPTAAASLRGLAFAVEADRLLRHGTSAPVGGAAGPGRRGPAGPEHRAAARRWPGCPPASGRAPPRTARRPLTATARPIGRCGTRPPPGPVARLPAGRLVRL